MILISAVETTCTFWAEHRCFSVRARSAAASVGGPLLVCDHPVCRYNVAYCCQAITYGCACSALHARGICLQWTTLVSTVTFNYPSARGGDVAG
jgi:hypothetical protein